MSDLKDAGQAGEQFALLPCPFCDNYGIRDVYENPQTAVVRCYGCCAQVSVVGQTSNPDDLQGVADSMWNTRTPQPTADAGLTEDDKSALEAGATSLEWKASDTHNASVKTAAMAQAATLRRLLERLK